MVLERDAPLLERRLRDIEVVDTEHGGTAVRRGPALAGAVEPEADRTGVELGPFVAMTAHHVETHGIAIEGNGPIHVAHPEPHVVHAREVHPPAPSSFARTTTAPEVDGTARVDCATAT